MKSVFGGIVAAVAIWLGMDARAEETAVLATNAPVSAPAQAVPTNLPAPLSTQAVAAVAAPVREAVTEWVGYVRAMRGDAGEVRAIRFVCGDKLYAVEMNDKAKALAQMPKTRRMLVKGAFEERQGRPWLVVSAFSEAPEGLVAPPVPTPPPPAVPVSTNTAPVAAATNVPPVPAVTNAPAPAAAP